MSFEPKPVGHIYIVVRQDDGKEPSYAPRSSEKRSKKYWVLSQAMALVNHQKKRGIPVKLYRAVVSEWEEVDGVG